MNDSDRKRSPAGLPRWSGWLLNTAYAALLLAVSPLLIVRCVRQGKYRSGWSEKLLGRVPRLPPPDTSVRRYWFHAVSVGEVLLLRSVLAELKRRDPSAEIVLSTTTSTGHAVARNQFPDVTVCYCPLDFTWAVKAAIARLRPTDFVLVELELWPNLLSAVARAGVPAWLINGRLSEHSFRGYSKIRWLLRPLLRSFRRIAVQNSTCADRFRKLGAAAERVVVTGSVKFDGIETRRDNQHTQALREAFGITAGERVFLAGSTQAPEEETAIAAWQKARTNAPDLRLILVPRHRERFDEVASLVTRHGLSLRRRSSLETDCLRASPATCGSAAESPVAGECDRRSSAGRDDAFTEQNTSAEQPVLLLDTLGELSACWGLADFAFVGGSLTKRGGQNMIEPAGYGAAVCFGPDTRNFRDTVDALLACEAAVVVTDAGSLAATLEDWLARPAAARALGRRAQQFVQSQRGATERTLAALNDETAPQPPPLSAVSDLPASRAA